MSGAIYLLSNPAMPGLYKLGMVNAPNTVEERIQQLSSTTGVPTPFARIWAERAEHPHFAERAAHALLDPWRVTRKREFFQCPSLIAIGGLLVGAAFANDEFDEHEALSEFNRIVERAHERKAA